MRDSILTATEPLRENLPKLLLGAISMFFDVWILVQIYRYGRRWNFGAERGGFGRRGNVVGEREREPSEREGEKTFRSDHLLA